MDEIVKKAETPADLLSVESSAEGTPVGLAESQDRELRLRVEAKSLEKMKKQALVTREAPTGGSAWSILCDEGAYLGGDDAAPPPLAYLSAAIAF